MYKTYPDPQDYAWQQARELQRAMAERGERATKLELYRWITRPAK